MVATHAYGGSLYPSVGRVSPRGTVSSNAKHQGDLQFEMEENRGVGTMERKVEGHSVAHGPWRVKTLDRLHHERDNLRQ